MAATITCKTLKCINKTTDDLKICDYCWQKHISNLKWLHAHIPDLEYRLNPTFGKTGENGSSRGIQPDAVRNSVLILLYESDDNGNDGVETTLKTYCRCLNIPYRINEPLTNLVSKLLNKGDELRSHSSTPAYIPQINHLRVKAQRLLEQSHEEIMSMGVCPNPDCNHDLACPVSANECKCAYCHNVWTVSFLRGLQHDRLVNDQNVGTQTEILALLRYQGIAIKPGTLRKWCSEGDVKPCGLRGKRKIYRLGDVYERAVKAGKRHVDSIWDMPGTKIKENK